MVTINVYLVTKHNRIVHSSTEKGRDIEEATEKVYTEYMFCFLLNPSVDKVVITSRYLPFFVIFPHKREGQI